MYLKWLGNSLGERVSEDEARTAFGIETHTDEHIETILAENEWHYVSFFLPLSDALAFVQAKWELAEYHERRESI